MKKFIEYVNALEVSGLSHSLSVALQSNHSQANEILEKPKYAKTIKYTLVGINARGVEKICYLDENKRYVFDNFTTNEAFPMIGEVIKYENII